MKMRFLIVPAIVMAGAASYFFAHNKWTEPTPQERSAAYHAAVEKGATQSATWPEDESEMAMAFWLAASRREWDQLFVYTPGAMAGDFDIFRKFQPGPPKAVGQPGPHPTAPGVVLYPVTVPFPGFPNKTIKMAFVRTDDGRVAVDGKNTIWW